MAFVDLLRLDWGLQLQQVHHGTKINKRKTRVISLASLGRRYHCSHPLKLGLCVSKEMSDGPLATAAAYRSAFDPDKFPGERRRRGVRHPSNLLLAVAWIRLLIHLRTPLMTWSIHAFRGNESISAAIASISQQHPGNWIRPLMDKNGFVSAAQLPSSTNMYACHNPKQKTRQSRPERH